MFAAARRQLSRNLAIYSLDYWGKNLAREIRLRLYGPNLFPDYMNLDSLTG